MVTRTGMLHPTQRHHEDSSVARWGGLAGIGGSVLMARTVENGLYLAVLVLWVPLALALFHSLRRTRPASALFGSALNIFGLAVLAAGAIPHVVTSRLSDLYHADGATPDEQGRWCSCGRRTRACSTPCCWSGCW